TLHAAVPPDASQWVGFRPASVPRRLELFGLTAPHLSFPPPLTNVMGHYAQQSAALEPPHYETRRVLDYPPLLHRPKHRGSPPMFFSPNGLTSDSLCLQSHSARVRQAEYAAYTPLNRRGKLHSHPCPTPHPAARASKYVAPPNLLLTS